MIDDPKSQAAVLRSEGHTNASIARQLCVGESTVRRWLAAKGWNRRDRKDESERARVKDAIAELKAEGFSDEAIRAVFG